MMAESYKFPEGAIDDNRGLPLGLELPRSSGARIWIGMTASGNLLLRAALLRSSLLGLTPMSAATTAAASVPARWSRSAAPCGPASTQGRRLLTTAQKQRSSDTSAVPLTASRWIGWRYGWRFWGLLAPTTH